MRLPTPRRLGWLRLSTLLVLLRSRGSEPTRNISYRIDRALGRLAVIR